jgi:hypothetical protein
MWILRCWLLGRRLLHADVFYNTKCRGEAQPWLFKTEPSSSFQQLEKDKKTMWDGVKNNLALKNLKDIKKGDPILIYHTGDEKAALHAPWATPIRTRARKIPGCWLSILEP